MQGSVKLKESCKCISIYLYQYIYIQTHQNRAHQGRSNKSIFCIKKGCRSKKFPFLKKRFIKKIGTYVITEQLIYNVVANCSLHFRESERLYMIYTYFLTATKKSYRLSRVFYLKECVEENNLDMKMKELLVYFTSYRWRT